MELTNKNIDKLNQEIEKLNRQKRIERKKLREEQKKIDSRRNYIIGEMVVKYFPELVRITPGTKTENAKKFSGFEKFLQTVSADATMMELFRECMEQSDAQCVSGPNFKMKGAIIMANYHLEIKNISRSKGGSIARRTSYIFGEMRDNYLGNNCYKTRSDVVFCNVFLPINAPPGYEDLQTLCDEIDKTEKRYDARTAKEFIGSLPNELPPCEIVKIVEDFVKTNFVKNGLAVVAAIHEGHNDKDKSRNNPHVHILVTTRTLGADGFNPQKARELNKKENVLKWRENGQ